MKPRKSTHKPRRVPAAGTEAAPASAPEAGPASVASADLGSTAQEDETLEQPPSDACAWCGTPVAEADAFVLRVGARLCPACAKRAGEIAAEQRRK